MAIGLRPVLLEDFEWRKRDFDNIIIASFSIENKNPFLVKDVVVVCEITAGSGTVLGHIENKIYQTIPAGGRRVVRDFKMGFIHNQAEQVSCTTYGWDGG
jgi:hypothetical protein